MLIRWNASPYSLQEVISHPSRYPNYCECQQDVSHWDTLLHHEVLHVYCSSKFQTVSELYVNANTDYAYKGQYWTNKCTGLIWTGCCCQASARPIKAHINTPNTQHPGIHYTEKQLCVSVCANEFMCIEFLIFSHVGTIPTLIWVSGLLENTVLAWKLEGPVWLQRPEGGTSFF